MEETFEETGGVLNMQHPRLAQTFMNYRQLPLDHNGIPWAFRRVNMRSPFLTSRAIKVSTPLSLIRDRVI